MLSLPSSDIYATAQVPSFAQSRNARFARHAFPRHAYAGGSRAPPPKRPFMTRIPHPRSSPVLLTPARRGRRGSFPCHRGPAASNLSRNAGPGLRSQAPLSVTHLPAADPRWPARRVAFTRSGFPRRRPDWQVAGPFRRLRLRGGRRHLRQRTAAHYDPPHERSWNGMRLFFRFGCRRHSTVLPSSGESARSLSVRVRAHRL